MATGLSVKRAKKAVRWALLRLCGLKLSTQKQKRMYVLRKILAENGFSAVLSGSIDWEEVHGALRKIEQARSQAKAAAKGGSNFYLTREWKELRYKILVMHGGKCMACGMSAKDGVKIHVDHIKPRSKWPELELEPSNLQILCEPCNIGKLNYDSTDWRNLDEQMQSAIDRDRD